MAIPLISLENMQGDKFNILEFTDAVDSPWVALISGVPAIVAIPPGVKFVRFAYALGGANVFVSPDVITLPAPIELSRAETNPVIRALGTLINQGISTLNLLSDADTNVHLYFYS